jgi:tRNA threonylcarbamoyladenosine biosynthesis protein TsaE
MGSHKSAASSLDSKFPSVMVRGENETGIIASALAAHVYGGMSVMLRGPLGVGKTALVRAMGRSLGVNAVKSPTFTIESVHNIPFRKFKLVHADLYRLESVTSGSDIAMQFEEYLACGELLVVEWGERWDDPPGDRWDITLSVPPESRESDDDVRVVDFEAHGESSHEAMAGAYDEIMDFVLSIHDEKLEGALGRCL